MASEFKLSRRRLLQALGLGGSALFMRHLFPAMAAMPEADSGVQTLFLHCTFDGGWDQLLALDPRDNTRFTDPDGLIYPAYDLLAAADPTLGDVLGGNPSGVIRPPGSNLSFGPAVGRLGEGSLWNDLTILRGVDMGTLTHEVGRRYFLTGKFPQGLQASGSSLATEFVHQSGDLSTIPNLAVGMESFNDGRAFYASGLQVRSSTDLQTVLTPLGSGYTDTTAAALAAYLGGVGAECQSQRLDGDGLVSQYLSSRTKALNMTESELGALFAFSATPQSESLQALNAAFNISSTPQTANQQLNGAAGEAMIAAQAFATGISQAVSIKLAQGIDHHDDDYLTAHSRALREGFDALADLINFLKGQPHPGTGQPLWSHTVLLVTSDFARTPNLNPRDGRDHHLASSCLVAGKGIVGNRVIGGTDDTAMGALGIDLATGEVAPGGWVMRPPDVHATLLAIMGLSWEHLENQEPRIISAMME